MRGTGALLFEIDGHRDLNLDGEVGEETGVETTRDPGKRKVIRGDVGRLSWKLEVRVRDTGRYFG